MPQSTSRRFPAASTRYFDPVTVPAAPRNVSLAISVPLYRIQRALPRRCRKVAKGRRLTRSMGWTRETAALVEPMGFETTNDKETKEFCGAAWPSKELKGKGGNS